MERVWKVFIFYLNYLAPSKTKYVRVNQADFMNKELQRVIMIKSELRRNLLKDRTGSNIKVYWKQKNICVNILGKHCVKSVQMRTFFWSVFGHFPPRENFSKSMHETNIPTKVLKESMDILPPFILNYFNNIIDS